MIRKPFWPLFCGIVTALCARGVTAQEPGVQQPAAPTAPAADEPAPTGTEAQRNPLTLAQVVRIALTRNERSRIAELSVRSAEAGVRRARAGFLPTITIGASETLRPWSEEQNGRQTVRSNAANAALTVAQPLLSASTFPAYSAAKHNAEAARWDAIDSRRQLSFDAARAFFGVIAAQRVLKAAERRLERADVSFNDTRSRAEAQLVSSNDVTRAQIERAKAVQSVVTARSSLATARVNLEYILDTEVAGELTAPAEKLAPESLDLVQLTNRAHAERPDIAAAREDVASTSASADEPGLRAVPTVNVAGQVRLADQDISGKRNYDTTVTLNLNWQLWDAGIRGADAISRRATADQAELQLKAMRRRVHADIRSAVSILQASRNSLTSAEQAVEAARRGADETNVLYKQGLAKAIELVDANLSRFDAEVGLAAAQLALRQAELDLRAALGQFPIEGVQ